MSIRPAPPPGETPAAVVSRLAWYVDHAAGVLKDPASLYALATCPTADPMLGQLKAARAQIAGMATLVERLTGALTPLDARSSTFPTSSGKGLRSSAPLPPSTPPAPGAKPPDSPPADRTRRRRWWNIPPELVAEARRAYEAGEPVGETSKRLGLHKNAIYEKSRLERWTPPKLLDPILCPVRFDVETWRDVPGTGGKYRASSEGAIVRVTKGSGITYPGRALKRTDDGLVEVGGKDVRYIAALCLTFLGPRPEGMVVARLPGCPTDSYRICDLGYVDKRFVGRMNARRYWDQGRAAAQEAAHA